MTVYRTAVSFGHDLVVGVVFDFREGEACLFPDVSPGAPELEIKSVSIGGVGITALVSPQVMMEIGKTIMSGDRSLWQAAS